MRVVGLIGGIGSGKSEASKILSSMGAHVIDADKVGHAVYEPGTLGFDRVVEAFGTGIVGEGGGIDRKALGALVFSAPGELERLNGIVHPLIRAEIERRIDAERQVGQTPLVVVEAAILLEAGWRAIVDEVWVVSASPEMVRARLHAGRGMSAAEVDARVARQMADADRRAQSDVVIDNDGDRGDLTRRLEDIWAARIAR